MKSIKPGRGPSAMNSVGSIFAAVFGVIWIFASMSMGAPWFFVLFGICFVVMAVVQAAYHWNNASSEERFSEYDIVDSREEGDMAERFLKKESRDKESEMFSDRESGSYCPYCGAKAEKDYRFCAQCGRELPGREKHN